jgi:hypothetical protein
MISNNFGDGFHKCFGCPCYSIRYTKSGSKARCDRQGRPCPKNEKKHKEELLMLNKEK